MQLPDGYMSTGIGEAMESDKDRSPEPLMISVPLDDLRSLLSHLEKAKCPRRELPKEGESIQYYLGQSLLSMAEVRREIEAAEALLREKLEWAEKVLPPKTIPHS